MFNYEGYEFFCSCCIEMEPLGNAISYCHLDLDNGYTQPIMASLFGYCHLFEF